NGSFEHRPFSLLMANGPSGGWTLQSRPQGANLEGVSCTSAEFCVAVGGTTATAETWNGSQWTPAALGDGGTLTGVSCVSPTDCTAVGTGGLAERWNGTSWALEATAPEGERRAELKGVACVVVSGCTAVGSSQLLGASTNVIETRRETRPTAPVVETGAASSVTKTSATLNAFVNPGGAEVSDCRLEYGTST